MKIKKEKIYTSRTEENLKETSAGGSQANREYLALAAKAEQDGHQRAAKLFGTAAEAEAMHAHNHLRKLRGIKNAKKHLQDSCAGETHEFKSMYPGPFSVSCVQRS